MKKIILIAIITLLCSCSIHTQQGQTHKNVDDLSKIERTIINTFLDAELSKERYIKFNNYRYIVIEEALKEMKSIDTYLYSLDEWNVMNKIKKSEDVKNMYFLDTLQINKIKNNLKNEDDYHWKVTDFKTIKVSLLKFEELRKNTNTGKYLGNNLIIYLSRPLIIDNNNALVSFEIGKGDVGFYPITHFTVLMRKENNKWVINGYYEDGVY